METATVLADRTGDVGSRIEDRAACLETTVDHLCDSSPDTAEFATTPP